MLIVVNKQIITHGLWRSVKYFVGGGHFPSIEFDGGGGL